jgi:hypothetical protein
MLPPVHLSWIDRLDHDKVRRHRCLHQIHHSHRISCHLLHLPDSHHAVAGPVRVPFPRPRASDGVLVDEECAALSRRCPSTERVDVLDRV